MTEYKRCQACGSPMIGIDNPAFKLWKCTVCGYVEINMQDQQVEGRIDYDPCIQVPGLTSPDSYSIYEASIPEYRITWHYVTSSTSSEALTEEGFYSPYADRVLSAEEYAALRELLANHPEIKSWWLKNNVLYLEVEDNKGVIFGGDKRE